MSCTCNKSFVYGKPAMNDSTKLHYTVSSPSATHGNKLTAIINNRLTGQTDIQRRPIVVVIVTARHGSKASSFSQAN